MGHRDERPDPDGLSLVQRSYDASGGTEFFLSFEDTGSDVIVAFLRLRMPEGAHRPEFGPFSAVVRELHVYGRMVPVGEERLDGWQHRGWGRRLMAEAERVASEDYGATKMLVMSALGTKEYYAGLGYSRDGAYVSKHL